MSIPSRTVMFSVALILVFSITSIYLNYLRHLERNQVSTETQPETPPLSLEEVEGIEYGR